MKSWLTNDQPRWADLSPTQKLFVSNGCGAKGGWFNPPSFMFTASCDQHDFHYWRGASEDDREEADAAFLRAMLRDASKSHWWIRWFHVSMARLYHGAVRRWGASHFTYRVGDPATWAILFQDMTAKGLDPLGDFL